MIGLPRCSELPFINITPFDKNKHELGSIVHVLHPKWHSSLSKKGLKYAYPLNRGGGVLVPQLYKGHPRPHIPPRVMVSSALGLKLGVFGFLPTTHAKTNTKQNANMISVCCAAFYTCLSSPSDHSRCRGHMLF